MTIKHHPDETSIIAYAAGTLDEAFAVLVSCHLESCSQCRETLTAAQLMGGSLLEHTDDAPVADGSFGRLLEKISVSDDKAEPRIALPAPTKGHISDKRDMPSALSHYIDSSMADIKWKRVGPGVWQKPIELSKHASSSLRLLRIAPGKSVPEHGHGGQEMTLILSGAYQDEIGHFGPGDVADLDDHVEHQPRVVSEEDCICLAATEAPTKFKGLASRLLQPLIGI